MFGTSPDITIMKKIKLIKNFLNKKTILLSIERKLQNSIVIIKNKLVLVWALVVDHC